MTTTVELSEHFGYVIFVVALSFVVHMYMAFQVVQARTRYRVFQLEMSLNYFLEGKGFDKFSIHFLLFRYDVQYPIMYAEQSHPNANAFNCIQVTVASVLPLCVI